jgi:uncharacterized membrane protein required for colicin V production
MIWLFAILVVLAGVGMGWRQGVIQASVTFVGIIFATLLAAPIGHLLQPLLHHVGFPNETEAWMIAPVVAFLIVLTVFKAIGFQLHRKSEAYHKHYVSELEFNIWKRLNTRLGICVGVLNGTAYMVLLTFIFFNIGYWTTQVATADTEPMTTRLVNRLATGAEQTGLANVAPSVGVLPPDYYRLADLAGLICQNPDLTTRLARYPMFTSLLLRNDIQQITSDSAFTHDWATHAPMGQMLKEPVIQSLIKNNDQINSIWVIVQTNMDDLTTFLKTGQSPKYDPEVVLGQWDFNVGVTFAYLRLTQESLKFSEPEVAAAKAWMANAYAQTILIVAADNQAYLKFWPDTKAVPQRGQPLPTLDYTGQWTQDGTNYEFTLAHDADTKTLSGTCDGQRLMLKDDRTTYVFDHD